MNARVASVAILLALAGCFPYHHSRPGAEGWSKGVRKVGVLSAIRVVQILPGGIEERHEEWTDQAAKNVLSALSEGLRKRGFTAKAMSWKGDAELDDVRLLYAEVAEAIWQYAYPPFAFEHKQERFDYAVGPIGKILDRAGADVLFVAAGGDKIGADGQKLSVLAGYRAMALLTLGLLDRAGDVVWFDLQGGAGIDLRSLPDVQAAVEKMLDELPGAAGAAGVAR